MSQTWSDSGRHEKSKLSPITHAQFIIYRDSGQLKSLFGGAYFWKTINKRAGFAFWSKQEDMAWCWLTNHRKDHSKSSVHLAFNAEQEWRILLRSHETQIRQIISDKGLCLFPARWNLAQHAWTVLVQFIIEKYVLEMAGKIAWQ